MGSSDGSSYLGYAGTFFDKFLGPWALAFADFPEDSAHFEACRNIVNGSCYEKYNCILNDTAPTMGAQYSSGGTILGLVCTDILEDIIQPQT